MRPRRTPAISAITRSPAGWPRVSLTCLKWSRSSISSAPVDAVAAAARQLARAGPPRSGAGSSARSAGPGWPARCSSCIRSLRLQTGPARQQRRQRDARRRRSSAAGRRRAGWGRGRPAARCGRRSWIGARGGFVAGQRRARRRLAAARSAARRRRSGRAAFAAAARSGTRKAPAAKPISAARRSATVAVGAPSR